MPGMCRLPRWRQEIVVLFHQLPHEPDRVRSALRLLSPEEQIRATSMTQDADRMRFVASRALLRTALAHGRAMAAPDVELAVRSGRVIATGFPGLEVSVAHSGAVVACCLAMRKVGIDVETNVADPADDVLVRRSCTAAEYAAVMRSPEPGMSFTRLWARKEAVGKALGVGLGLPVDRVDVRRRTVRGLAAPGVWSVADVRAVDGYAAAVAASGRLWRARVMNFQGLFDSAASR